MTPSSERGLTMVELLVSSAVMVVVLLMTTSVMVSSSRMFGQQRAALDARDTAGAAMDLITRLLRQSSCISDTDVYCQAIFPDPDNNGTFDSVRVRSDWNPRDGAYDDPYEDVLFVVANGSLWKREPTDAALVSFGPRVQSIAFAYTNQNGGPLANVLTRPDLIGGVNVTITSINDIGMPVTTSSGTISVRRIK
ncbi:PilW family protein [Luteitalea sp. TBR-22]|uniref:PilW family protein n=1 Tax=Luteitalea sp. TBR-22 TaxID=2802971 RepID=UPI001EF587B7|nr:prepilin-type N-terminal cleavage/methylation domain-containing protein [Luteitalea sp. TBR-22]